MATRSAAQLSRKAIAWIAVGVVVLLGLVAFSMFRQASRVDRPVTYANDADHFKYGSISSDVGGIPYWIWATMPEVCRGNLPGGYASLGVIQEPGKATPIGFSVRKVGFLEQVGPNCALRHTLGRWLEAEGVESTFDLQRRAEEVPVAEYLALARRT